MPRARRCATACPSGVERWPRTSAAPGASPTTRSSSPRPSAPRRRRRGSWRGAGQQLPPIHAVIPGLAGQDATGGSPEGLAGGVRALLDQIPDGGLALAISHTPLVERAAFG